MRIDGFTSSYTLDRTPRPGSAVTPFREVQREAETRRDVPASPSTSQGIESTPQQRRVQASTASSDSLPARSQDVLVQRSGVSNRAQQALASYASTASYSNESDASEILGLDTYA
ncbi:hypothetical protein ACVW0Y_000225 [Pseudomonas sp. TE3786]